MDFAEKKELFKVRKTVLEMVHDRAYIIPEEIQNISFEQFCIQYDQKNIDLYINDTLKSEPIYVHFYNELKSFGKNDLKNLVQKVMNTYQNENIKIILVLREKENSAVAKELAKDAYKNIEIFLKKNLITNITHHEYQPRFVLLTKEQEDEVLEKYVTTKSKLPKLLQSDPVAKYYGMKHDQICMIIRKSPEVGEYISYRVVR